MVEQGKVRLTFGVPEIVVQEEIVRPARSGSTETRQIVYGIKTRQRRIDLNADDVELFTAPAGKRASRSQVAKHLKENVAVFICIGTAPASDWSKWLKDGTLILVVSDHTRLFGDEDVVRRDDPRNPKLDE